MNPLAPHKLPHSIPPVEAVILFCEGWSCTLLLPRVKYMELLCRVFFLSGDRRRGSASKHATDWKNTCVGHTTMLPPPWNCLLLRFAQKLILVACLGTRSFHLLKISDRPFSCTSDTCCTPYNIFHLLKHAIRFERPMLIDCASYRTSILTRPTYRLPKPATNTAEQKCVK